MSRIRVAAFLTSLALSAGQAVGTSSFMTLLSIASHIDFMLGVQPYRAGRDWTWLNIPNPAYVGDEATP